MMNENPLSDDSDNDEYLQTVLTNYHNSRMAAAADADRRSPPSTAAACRRDDDDSPLLIDDESAAAANNGVSAGSVSTAASTQLPLIPSDCDDLNDAHENFVRVFEARYGEKHPFFNPISLFDAIKDVQTAHYSIRRPLLIYIHNDNSILTQVFCTQVLCQQAIVDFINSNFVFWAWDFTLEENRTKLIEWVENVLGHEYSLPIRGCTNDEFPLLIILGKMTGGVELINLIKGPYLLEEVMHQLMNALDGCQAQKALEAAQDQARQSREQMLMEQDHAYNESLRADRLKAHQKLQEEQDAKEQEQKKIQADRLKEQNRLKIESRLEPEPPETCDQPMTQVRIRCVDGETLERRFLLSHHLQALFDFVASKNFPIADYKLLTKFPPRDISSFEPNRTFGETKFSPREAIYMESR